MDCIETFCRVFVYILVTSLCIFVTVGGYTLINKIEVTGEQITDRLQSVIPELPRFGEVTKLGELPSFGELRKFGKEISSKFEKTASDSGNFVSTSADVILEIATYGQVFNYQNTCAKH